MAWPGAPEVENVRWPADLPQDESLASIIAFFESLGYQQCGGQSLEDGFEKVALFADPEDDYPTHAARQLPKRLVDQQNGLERRNHRTRRPGPHRRALLWLGAAVSAATHRLTLTRQAFVPGGNPHYNHPMQLTVRLFALYRERAGCRSFPLELRDGATVEELTDAVRLRFPMLAPPDVNIVVAVNADYAEPDLVLQPNDDVCLIPPVSGG